jgi:hypothetical protein
VQTSTNKTQQGSANKHHQNTTREFQQAPIKYNNGEPISTNKTQQNADEY